MVDLDYCPPSGKRPKTVRAHLSGERIPGQRGQTRPRAEEDPTSMSVLAQGLIFTLWLWFSEAV